MAPRSRILLPVTLLLHLIVNTAAAEPIVVNGGSLLLTGPFEVGSVSISGTRGFSLQGPVDPAEGGTNALQLCPSFECDQGMEISLLGGFGELMFQENRLTIDGQEFILQGGVNGEVNLFMLISGAVVLPPFGERSAIDLTTPFSMEGILALSPLGPRIPMAGSGRIHVFLDRSPIPSPDAPGWRIDAVRWDFEPAPIPEPSSLLLVCGGATLLFRRCRRRSHATADH